MIPSTTASIRTKRNRIGYRFRLLIVLVTVAWLPAYEHVDDEVPTELEVYDRVRMDQERSAHASLGLTAYGGFGVFDSGSSVDKLPMGVDGEADIEAVTVLIDRPLRNAAYPRFGFYGGAGLGATRYTWDAEAGDDLEVLGIGPRLEAGYEFLFGRLVLRLGAHVEYGITMTSDFAVPGFEFEGEREEYFLTGLVTACYYRFAYGTGPELGIYAQGDHRRVRLAYNTSAIGIPGDTADLASGQAWVVGLLASFRF